MFRSILAVVLVTSSGLAMAQSCSVSGTAYDLTGKPQHDAVVRLTNQQTRQSLLVATDANATFHFAGVAAGSQAYRVDLLGVPTAVTGSRIPTRSIVGMTPEFSCRPGQSEHQDVRAGV